VFRKWGLDAAKIGSVIESPILRVKQHGETVAEIPNRALTDDAPVYQRPWKAAERTVPMDSPEEGNREKGIGNREHGIENRKEGIDERKKSNGSLTWFSACTGAELREDLLKLLGSPTIASKRWISEQYDTMVRTNTVIGPGGDAALLRIKETSQGLAMSVDGNGRYCFLDPRRGARLAVAESARNVSVTGARPLAATNCLNFGNPEKPAIMWQFREVIEGMSEACEALSIPITGGNVSFYNETEGRPIYPTPVVGVVGLLENVERHATAAFRNSGRTILLLGGLVEDSGPTPASESVSAFGSSEYVRTILGTLWGVPPLIDLEVERRVQAGCRRMISEGLVESAHDVSDGGLAVCLAECCLGNRIGATVELSRGASRLNWLFAEDPSRIVISVPPDHLAVVDRIAGEYNIRAEFIGTTGESSEPDGSMLRFLERGQLLFEVAIAQMGSVFGAALEKALAGS